METGKKVSKEYNRCLEYKKVVMNKQKMSEKRSENEMVMSEFKMLDDDATVFKMVGPVLAKQSLFECMRRFAI